MKIRTTRDIYVGRVNHKTGKEIHIIPDGDTEVFFIPKGTDVVKLNGQQFTGIDYLEANMDFGDENYKFVVTKSVRDKLENLLQCGNVILADINAFEEVEG